MRANPLSEPLTFPPLVDDYLYNLQRSHSVKPLIQLPLPAADGTHPNVYCSSSSSLPSILHSPRLRLSVTTESHTRLSHYRHNRLTDQLNNMGKSRSRKSSRAHAPFRTSSRKSKPSHYREPVDEAANMYTVENHVQENLCKFIKSEQNEIQPVTFVSEESRHAIKEEELETESDRPLGSAEDVNQVSVVSGAFQNKPFQMVAPMNIQPNNSGSRVNNIRNDGQPTSVPATVPPASLNLPYVDSSMLAQLADQRSFIELADLHPDALKPTADVMTFITFDPEQPEMASVTTRPRRTIIDSFPIWSQCFSTFHGYRAYFFPHEVIHMSNYHRFIASLAEVYKPEAWLGYDKAFRLKMACHPEQHENWSLPDTVLAFHYLQQDPDLRIPKCETCGQKGHLKIDCHKYCTNLNNVNQFVSTSQSNRNSPQICRKFNRGACHNACPAGRLHKCSACLSPDHGRYLHHMY